MSLRSAALLLVALVGAAAPGCSGQAQPNVLLIVVDTLRADHLGAYGYRRQTAPSIDALAAEGTLFQRAYSPTSWTKPALASILTGLYPSSHHVERPRSILQASFETVTERLQAAGYRTGGVISHTLLSHEAGYGQGFDVYLEDHARGESYQSTQGVTSQAIELLRGFASEADRPFFLFVHYFDPHYSYVGHPQYAFSSGPSGRLTGKEHIRQLRWMSETLTAEELGFLRDRYDEEIRHTDEGIGLLLDALRESGLFDDTLIVLTADHGEEFLERGWLGHTRTLYDELIRVPLVIRDPSIAEPTRVVAEPVSTVSIPATILDATGVGSGEGRLQEASLRPIIAGEARAGTHFVFSEVDFVPLYAVHAKKETSKVSLIGPRYKLVWDRKTSKLELFDLLRDAGEQENLADAQPELVQRLLPLLRERAEKPGGPPQKKPPAKTGKAGDTGRDNGREELDFDAEEIEHLRSLGYVDP